jgi:aminopeptidase N
MKPVKTHYLKDYQPTPYAVESLHLRFVLEEDSTRVISTARYVLRDGAVGGCLDLHGEHLRLIGLKRDGQPLSDAHYTHTDEGLRVLACPETFELECETEIEPQKNTALSGLYKSGGNFCTQCEAEGFRRITYYPDRPDVMTIFTTRIEADKARYPVLLSNGNLMERGDLPEGRQYSVWHDPHKKPSYLFALVAGDLEMVEDHFVTQSGRQVTLRIFAQAHNIDQCDFAMQSLKNSMRWDEERFGLEYDLDIFMIVAVDDFNMGAMENKGLNIFNSKLVFASPQTATDFDYESIDAVIAHEYFHNWTGNRVTCRDWFQLTLKEGLTVFRDQEYTSDQMSRAVKRIDDVKLLRAFQFPEDAGAMSHPIQPTHYIEMNNFYTLTVYEKGAEVIRMYQTLLGVAGFRKGMDLYFARHDGQAVTVDEFRAAMADANGRDLTQFRRWYEQKGTPVALAQGEYDAMTQRYTLHLTQKPPRMHPQDAREPLHIPFALGLLDAQGRDLLPEGTRVLDWVQTQQSFVFEGIASEPIPSLLRNFSAPVELEFDYSNEQLAFLLAHDTDAFNRWEAGQTLMARAILQDQGYASDALLEGLRATLLNDGLEPAFRAFALALPDMAWLAEQTARVDIDGLTEAHRRLEKEIARALLQDFQAIYQKMACPPPYQPSAEQAGKRALRNLALRYWMALDSSDALHAAWNQFHAAENMTDVSAALGLMASSARQEREVVLHTFYEHWKKQPLVLDKWFALQAGSKHPNALAHCVALSQHKDFNLKNPNRVRSLLAVMMRNLPVFHHASGRGYQLLADNIIELNAINPQIGARMAAGFNQYKRYDDVRQALMHAQLLRIQALPDLAKDIAEIITRALDA